MEVVVTLLLIVAIFVAIRLAIRTKALTKELAESEGARASLKTELDAVKARSLELSRFETVLDAEGEAAELVRVAEEQSQAAVRRAHGDAELLRQQGEAALNQRGTNLSRSSQRPMNGPRPLREMPWLRSSRHENSSRPRRPCETSSRAMGTAI